MATFDSNFLYALDEHGASTNGKVVSQIPNSGSHSVESNPDGVIKVGETFTVTFSDPTTGATYDGTYTYVGYETAVSGAIGEDSSGNFFLFTNDGSIPDGQQLNGFVAEDFPICFAAGTLIRTPGGDVPVEKLKAGDLVLTASGEMRRVKWMGHKDVDFRRSPGAKPGQPIRIAADAFGPVRPSQDLYLSAGHSVCVDLLGEMFIPVGYLVNGATIAKVEVEEISYWHVELDSRDILIANNLPAESYLAMGNRAGFEERRGLLPAMVEGRERTHADFCRPVVTEGPVLDFVRHRLIARAEEMGWKRLLDADLHLMADSEVVHPCVEGSLATFQFPATAKDVRLMSNVFSPAPFGSNDPRMLGVMLCDEIAFGDQKVSLGDERLRDGVHQLEDHGGYTRRWTNGELVLDPQFWDGQSGLVSLVVNCDLTTVRGWTAPAMAEGSAPVVRPELRAVG